MDILILVLGLFMIGIGFLVKSSPNLISGYNTMSEDKKKNVDIEGLSSMMRNGFILIGLSLIVGYFLFKWMGFNIIAESMILIVNLVGGIILVIKAQAFDHNKKRKINSNYIILGIAALLVTGLISYGFIPSKTTYSSDAIQFSGMYGFEIRIDQIEHIELTDKIPKIKTRTNGFSVGSIKKGFYNLDQFGKSQLLIHSNIAPYLILSNTEGTKTIINFTDKMETEVTYNKIKALIEK